LQSLRSSKCRLIVEAKHSIALSHPNVVSVLDLNGHTEFTPVSTKLGWEFENILQGPFLLCPQAADDWHEISFEKLPFRKEPVAFGHFSPR
jgi:hypothetical protein